MNGRADHYCSYACMAHDAVSDTEVPEAHEFDGTCITCGVRMAAWFEPFEVERGNKGRYFLVPLSSGAFEIEEAKEVARQASRAFDHHGVRQVWSLPKIGLRIALYDPPNPRPSWH